jgi:hypothetical protein
MLSGLSQGCYVGKPPVSRLMEFPLPGGFQQSHSTAKEEAVFYPCATLLSSTYIMDDREFRG